MASFNVNVEIDYNSLVCLDALRNLYLGRFRGRPSLFFEYRPLRYHRERDIDVRSTLENQIYLRQQYQTQNHVPVASLYVTGPDLGSKTFLVETQHGHAMLKDYLSQNPNVDRVLLLKQALRIVRHLHSKGVTLGTVMLKSFVVDDSRGELLLSGFDHMRIENSDVHFQPLSDPSLRAMCHMAPEVLESIRDGSGASFNRATDMYAMGCFAYELFTGNCPLAPSYQGLRKYIAQLHIFADVIEGGKRPERPTTESDAFARFGMTSEIWNILESCWVTIPANRPSASDLISLITQD